MPECGAYRNNFSFPRLKREASRVAGTILLDARFLCRDSAWLPLGFLPQRLQRCNDTVIAVHRQGMDTY